MPINENSPQGKDKPPAPADLVRAYASALIDWEQFSGDLEEEAKPIRDAVETTRKALLARLEAQGNPPTPAPGLDQLHDEMANALMRVAQLYHAFMDAVKKEREGVQDAKAAMEYIEGLGGATALCEDALRKYAAVASGELEPPPKPQGTAPAHAAAANADDIHITQYTETFPSPPVPEPTVIRVEVLEFKWIPGNGTIAGKKPAIEMRCKPIEFQARAACTVELQFYQGEELILTEQQALTAGQWITIGDNVTIWMV